MLNKVFVMLYRVVLTFKSVDETLVCDHSNESHWAVLSSGAVCFLQFCKIKLKILFSVLNFSTRWNEVVKKLILFRFLKLFQFF